MDISRTISRWLTGSTSGWFPCPSIPRCGMKMSTTSSRRSAGLLPGTERQRTLPRQRRKAEAVLAAVALLLAAPLLAAIAIGIRISDPGPVFYVAERVGARGVRFRMYKFRTMRVAAGRGSRITEAGDPR